MKTISTSATKKISDGKTYKPKGEGYYDVDDVLDAYNAGKHVGAANVEKAFADLLKRNIRDASKFLNSVVSQLYALDIPFTDVYIRHGRWPEIEILMAVRDTDYVKKDFKVIYDVVFDLEQEYNNESLQIYISFLPVNEHFNEAQVLSDAYVKIEKESE